PLSTGAAAPELSPLSLHDALPISMHGDPLLREEAMEAIRSLMFPRATLVTPNLDEVRLLVGIDVRTHDQQREAAKVLHELGPQRSEEHTSELQSRENLVCRLLLEK